MNRRLLLKAGAAAVLTKPPMTKASTETMYLRCGFAGQEITYRLSDTPTTRDLVSLLPLDLTIEDFSTNEKLAYLPRRLDEGGLADYADEAPGDLCYFRAWGNLAFFHAAYRYRGDLIRLGQTVEDLAPLRIRGPHPLRLELL